MVKIFQVDAFTSEPFKGNPAAVCLLDSARDDIWMQSVAQEMNLSETAFLLPLERGFSLRWFTPAVEVSLCGHATLASAHILWEAGEEADELIFNTLSGELRVWRDGALIWMDFPVDTLEPTKIPQGLVGALGLSELDGVNIKCSKGCSDYLLHLDSPNGEDILNSLTPDFKSLSLIASRGFIVTTETRIEGFDFVSRFFAPGSGIDEDPVTGSAHTMLGPYWAGLLDKSSLRALQVSKRGGVVLIDMQGSLVNRIHIGGEAVTISRGELIR
jgi:PhzF family phenazine biosynthesis protein